MNLSEKFEMVNISDIGQRRPHNEDSTLCDAGAGLVILADGMGGYKAGEIASAIAVSSIHRAIIDSIRTGKPGRKDKATGLSYVSTIVRDAITQVNSEIYNMAQSDRQCHGMGTTIVVVLFHNNICTIGHVGDSRLYRVRSGEFTQLTKDHSLIQELIDRGMYAPEEAEKHAPRNLITRAVGIEPVVEVDLDEDDVMQDDIYMLCSDGLNDMVEDEEIHLTLGKYSANLAKCADELVRLANKKGGKDNISVVLVRVLGEFSKSGGGVIKSLKGRFF